MKCLSIILNSKKAHDLINSKKNKQNETSKTKGSNN